MQPVRPTARPFIARSYRGDRAIEEHWEHEPDYDPPDPPASEPDWDAYA